MSSVAERSPSWAPWEWHPDPKRSVGHVPTPGGVAAATHPGLSVALVKATLSHTCSGDYALTSENEVGDAPCDRPSPVASNLQGGG